MPEDAARRFAVMGAVEPIYNKNIIIWQITLHAITKETAQEAEVMSTEINFVRKYSKSAVRMKKALFNQPLMVTIWGRTYYISKLCYTVI